ncbi:WXG100 family type VII secretion target [Williamsia sterculiae]|uniref:ESAT-6-like protein n=1 Tax=Williamsia sterculiae TaxID=1344003 RepID=A0A1N7GST3_9NOCA|nr:WXG100 family type VII secretion target [Williamsia sterculiae]SIS15609.1 WXG100 family type VII secretion target [Williamsia sterculiae]
MNLDTAGGHAGVQQVQGQIEEMQSLLKAVNSQVAAAASWKGSASSTFHGVAEDWQAHAGNLQRALDTMRENLNGSFQGYEQAEEQAASGFNGLKL